MLLFKETFNVNLGGNKLKKVKGAPYFSNKLKRDLFVHADIDNDKHTSVSDVATGYRLFNLSQKYDKIKEEDIEQRIDEYIKHYTIPAIEEEFRRVEKLITESVSK